MIEMAEDGFTKLKNCQNGMLAVEIGFQIDSKEVEEGRCMFEVMESCVSLKYR